MTGKNCELEIKESEGVLEVTLKGEYTLTVESDSDGEKSAEYHLNVKPLHSPPYLDTLKELAISTATGRYRNISTSVRTIAQNLLCFMPHLP